MAPDYSSFAPVVCVVGFHHARGPEIESWFGTEDGSDPAVENDWSFLPFMALSDGAHASTEDFSYFTLRRHATETSAPTSVFGISCTRQLDASELHDRPAEVTRSTVQKAVVAIADSPQCFGQLREKLSMVTGAWFAQKDFSDVDILKKFQESLGRSLQDTEDDQYLGVSLRELIHEYKHQTLVLFKCCLLQPKMLFFGTRCERLCMVQFALISLIPGLLRRLEDCADPEFDSYEKNLVTPTSLKSSERTSCIVFLRLDNVEVLIEDSAVIYGFAATAVGNAPSFQNVALTGTDVPIGNRRFGKGAMFGPYTPLQQLDVLSDYGTKSYIVGSTNSLLLQQKDRYSDILINLDESTTTITSSSLRTALALSAADRRWIDFLSQTVIDTWDPFNPSRPRTLGYMGSEEFIRLQFEEYLLALLSSTKHHLYLLTHGPLPGIEGDPIADFNPDFLTHWQQTSSFALFNTHTDSHLFDIVEPRHPTAGNLSFEDIQRRVAIQIQTLHLDDRIATSKEVLNKHLATGHKKVSTAFTNVWADIAAVREAQRKRAEAANSRSASPTRGNSSASANPLPPPPTRFGGRAPDMAAAQASVQAASQKAGAYLSSWGAWATEKKKGWAEGRTENVSTSTSTRGGSGNGEKSPTRLARWNSSASLSGKKVVKEEMGGDGIGRLDA